MVDQVDDDVPHDRTLLNDPVYHNKSRFPGAFEPQGNGFVEPGNCFVAAEGMKQGPGKGAEIVSA